MGCDIHFYVERCVNGKWLTADKWQPADPDNYREVSFVDYEDHFYNNRNYDLFAILANVRNGSGFAGIKTGEGFEPLSEPRGVPEDACTEYKDIVDSWSGDGHSHSYCTVQELFDYDWTRTTKKQGWVNRRGYAHFKVKGSPDSWSGMISGGGIEHISNEEMEALDLKEGKYDPWAAFHSDQRNEFRETKYTLVKWEIPYYVAGRQFLSETMPRLWRLGKPDEVRCLFFFDN